MNWVSGEPDGDGGDGLNVQDCVARRQGTGKWVDIDCDHFRSFYCEGNVNVPIFCHRLRVERERESIPGQFSNLGID